MCMYFCSSVKGQQSCRSYVIHSLRQLASVYIICVRQLKVSSRVAPIRHSFLTSISQCLYNWPFPPDLNGPKVWWFCWPEKIGVMEPLHFDPATASGDDGSGSGSGSILVPVLHSTYPLKGKSSNNLFWLFCFTWRLLFPVTLKKL